MSKQDVPSYVAMVLSRLDGVRSTRNGWDARCPCPDHNASSGQSGDHDPSLGISVAENGRILVKCRVGCPTDKVLDVLGLSWEDLFPPRGAEVQPLAVASEPPLGRSDPAVVHRAYMALLEHLELSEGHQQQLLDRGIPRDRIGPAQYRTLRNFDRGRVAKAAHADLGDEVLSVPGFVCGEHGVTLAGTSTGLLVPVRDAAGGITALKIRREGDPKYLYLAGGESGKSCGSPVHVPLGVPQPSPVVRLTEGELKADVCTWLDETPTIGVPGVTQWRTALPVLRTLGVEKVVIAYDSPDLYAKLPVYEQARQLWRALCEEGYEVELEDWYA